MFLTINTAQQNQTTIALSRDNFIIIKKTWPTKFHESEKLLPEIDKLLNKAKHKLANLKGIIVVNGPGGFSALRIGIACANTLAYALKIPVTGIKLTEFKDLDELIKIGESKLKKVKKNNIVEPHYGKEPEYN